VAKAGAGAAVIVPVGFVSDHMEVRHDLDTEAMETAAGLGLPVERAATPWYHPQFQAMVTELVRERLDAPDDGAGAAGGDAAGRPQRPALGRMGPSTDVCPPGCCALPRRPGPDAAADSPEAAQRRPAGTA
jgi:ferrochelatase